MATRRAWTAWRSPASNKKGPGRQKIKSAQPPRTWRIVRGDKVAVVNGPEKGKVGEVLRTVRDRGLVLIEGVRLKERKLPPSSEYPKGRVTTYETPLHVSAVQLVDPTDGLATKVRMDVDADGRTVRVSKRTGTPIPKPRYEDTAEGRKAAEKRKEYKQQFCDTSAADASRVTFRPSALSFEEEVIASMRGLEIDWSRLPDADVADPLDEPRS